MIVVETRPARPEDAAVLSELIVEMQRHYKAPHPPRPEIEAQLRALPPGVEMLVAICDGRLSGLAAFSTIFPGPGLSPGVFLKDLYVASGNRGQGVGLALMRALAMLAQTRGLGRIDWTVAKDNLDAIAFYGRLGGEAQTDRHFYRLTGPELKALASD